MSDQLDRPTAPPQTAPVPPPPQPDRSGSLSGKQGDGWPRQATDTIVDVVGKVRDKTTGPITKVARYIVYGTFALIAGTIALVLLSIFAVRILDNYVTGHNVWIAQFAIGALFLAVAAFCFSRALAKPKPVG